MTVRTTRSTEVGKTEPVTSQGSVVVHGRKSADTPARGEIGNLDTKGRKTVPWYEGYRPGYFC